MKIQFPKTNYVECVFSVEQNRSGRTCKFENSGIQDDVRELKRYIYEVPEYLQDQLHVGDFVVVRCITGYQLAQVASINATPWLDRAEYSPVVAKVDLFPYLDALRKKEELKQMRRALEEAKKSLESLVTYELLAEKSPEFKAMLDAYKEAGGKF